MELPPSPQIYGCRDTPWLFMTESVVSPLCVVVLVWQGHCPPSQNFRNPLHGNKKNIFCHLPLAVATADSLGSFLPRSLPLRFLPPQWRWTEFCLWCSWLWFITFKPSTEGFSWLPSGLSCSVQDLCSLPFPSLSLTTSLNHQRNLESEIFWTFWKRERTVIICVNQPFKKINKKSCVPVRVTAGEKDGGICSVHSCRERFVYNKALLKQT